MNRNQELRLGRHCVFAMHVHLIFVTKYRRKVFDGDAIAKLGEHLERHAVEPKLLRCILRRRSAGDHQTLCRTAKPALMRAGRLISPRKCGAFGSGRYAPTHLDGALRRKLVKTRLQSFIFQVTKNSLFTFILPVIKFCCNNFRQEFFLVKFTLAGKRTSMFLVIDLPW